MGKDVIVACDFSSAEATFAFLDKFAGCERKPFLKIGIQYLVLKAVASVCLMVEGDSIAGLLEDVSSAMGLLLGITGSVCVLLLISTVCFMKGFG